MAAIATPCIKLCVLDAPGGVCLGCGRTTAEIAAWVSFSDDERRTIMADLPARMAAREAERLQEASR
jgi:uncharacterized protein